MKLALERLGFGPCHHMSVVAQNPDQLALWTRVINGEVGDWDAIYRDFRSAVDWPGARYWSEITRHFSQAKVILTVRDPERWYESVKDSIYRMAGRLANNESIPPYVTQVRDFIRRVVWDGDFGGRFEDKDYAISVFNEHNEAIRREVPADRLLVFEVREGWEPLCAFLDVPVPDEPFPHANDREEFIQQAEQRLKQEQKLNRSVS